MGLFDWLKKDKKQTEKTESLPLYLYDESEIVASWVVPHSVGPRFPGPLLIRTRCPDTSPNSTL